MSAKLEGKWELRTSLMAARDPLESFHDLAARDEQGAVSLADEALGGIAETGRVHYQWNHLKPVLVFKLNKNLKLAFPDVGPSESENENQCDELLQRLAGFSNPPFTIQRLCELLVFPCKHYNRIDKYLRALERVLMVVTCMEPELGGEQRVPPLTSVPTQDLAGGGAGEESGGCTSPSGLVLEDSRGTRKRELATVELQEADSTVEGAEDDSETPTKKAKWEQGQEECPSLSTPAAGPRSEIGATPEGLSPEALPGAGSTGSPKGEAATGASGHGGLSLDFSVQDHSAAQPCPGGGKAADEELPMEVGEVGEAEDRLSTCDADRTQTQEQLTDRACVA